MTPGNTDPPSSQFPIMAIFSSEQSSIQKSIKWLGDFLHDICISHVIPCMVVLQNLPPTLSTHLFLTDHWETKITLHVPYVRCIKTWRRTAWRTLLEFFTRLLGVLPLNWLFHEILKFPGNSLFIRSSIAGSYVIPELRARFSRHKQLP